jgi:hypothetical protein
MLLFRTCIPGPTPTTRTPLPTKKMLPMFLPVTSSSVLPPSKKKDKPRNLAYVCSPMRCTNFVGTDLDAERSVHQTGQSTSRGQFQSQLCCTTAGMSASGVHPANWSVGSSNPGFSSSSALCQCTIVCTYLGQNFPPRLPLAPGNHQPGAWPACHTGHWGVGYGTLCHQSRCSSTPTEREHHYTRGQVESQQSPAA